MPVRTHSPFPSTPAPALPATRGVRGALLGRPADLRTTDLGLLLLRVVAGLSLAFGHGIGKVPPSERFVARVAEMGFPLPELFAWLAGITEFGCALLLVVGLLTRPAAFLIVGNMAVVVLLAHAGDPFGDREAGLLFGAIALLFLLAGAGRYSLDALLQRRSS